MIKVLPLLTIPILFLIFFLNVKNLTSNFQNNYDIEVVENDNLDLELDKNKISKPNNPKDSDDTVSQKHKEIDDSSTNNSETDDVKVKNIELKSKENNAEINSNIKNLNKTKFEKNNKAPEVRPKPDQLKPEIKLIKIQFGAFSKMKNAEDYKEKVSEVMSLKFPEFEEKLIILEENKLYKLIYSSKNLLITESICDYSKSKRISCLILRK